VSLKLFRQKAVNGQSAVDQFSGFNQSLNVGGVRFHNSRFNLREAFLVDDRPLGGIIHRGEKMGETSRASDTKNSASPDQDVDVGFQSCEGHLEGINQFRISHRLLGFSLLQNQFINGLSFLFR
jgi:hypothetical protein